MEWTSETIAQLRDFWDAGLSTAEIGRRLGVTKNAVVGKAHRLALSARPSPIKRPAEAGRLPRVTVARRASGPALTFLRPSASEARQPDALRPQPTIRVVPPARTAGRVSVCCWPIGEPGTASFHFCAESAIHGKPYCGQHAALAYVKVRDRRDDAA